MYYILKYIQIKIIKKKTLILNCSDISHVLSNKCTLGEHKIKNIN